MSVPLEILSLTIAWWRPCLVITKAELFWMMILYTLWRYSCNVFSTAHVPLYAVHLASAGLVLQSYVCLPWFAHFFNLTMLSLG
jgi:hypothetical protein